MEDTDDSRTASLGRKRLWEQDNSDNHSIVSISSESSTGVPNKRQKLGGAEEAGHKENPIAIVSDDSLLSNIALNPEQEKSQGPGHSTLGPQTEEPEVPASAVAEGRRLYVGNCPYAATKENLKKFFNQYGVERVDIPSNPRTGFPVGYAFVELASGSDAMRAVDDLNNKSLLDRPLSLEIARRPSSRPESAVAPEPSQDAEIPQVSIEKLPLKTTAKQLQDFFSENLFNTGYIDLKKGRRGNISFGSAIVCLPDWGTADSAISSLNGKVLEGQHITVRYTKRQKTCRQRAEGAQRPLRVPAVAQLPSLDQDAAEADNRSATHELQGNADETGLDAPQILDPRIILDKDQRAKIRAFELKRASKIFKMAFREDYLQAQTSAGACVFLTASIPQAPGKKKGKKVQKSALRESICKHIAEYASEGLTGLWYHTKQHPNEVDVFRVFLLYGSISEAQKAMNGLRSTDCVVSGASVRITVSNAVPKATKSRQGKGANQDSLVLSKNWTATPRAEMQWFSVGRAKLVQERLQAAELKFADYDGFKNSLPQLPSPQLPPHLGVNEFSQSGQALSEKSPLPPEDISNIDMEAVIDVTSRQLTAPAMDNLQDRRCSSPQVVIYSQAVSNSQDQKQSELGEEVHGHVVGGPSFHDTSRSSGEVTSVNSPTALSGAQIIQASDREPQFDQPPRSENQSIMASTHSLASAPAPVPSHRSRVSQLSDFERQMQAHYWGIVTDDVLVRCTTCAQEGHMPEACPARTCKHCQAVDEHFSNACPTIRKCTKCRERGHASDRCPSKLARSNADGFSCDWCRQTGHGEDECSLMWRTFDPDQVPKLNKVSHLLRSCYQCGSNAHWGDDCPMRSRRDRVNCDTFSAKQANRYLLAPQPRFQNYTTAADMGLSIKGRAENFIRQVTNLGSDEDDAAAFTGKRKTERAPPRGNIRINLAGSSNITTQGQGSREANTYRPLQQPGVQDYYQNNQSRASYFQRPRSRSPDSMYRSYDLYRAHGMESREVGGYGWQPPLQNEPIPPPRRDQYYDNRDLGWQPPLPSRPPPPPLGRGGRNRRR